ncbi:hypothetical protein SAMN02910418_00008 [Bowdeniella nasicola]|uniref:Uncharacterized protein n=1 Tax=Bowdeniella nasicola TaxID=208480 RepID=A0A1H3VEU3_9ACTO|nr:hypothetical protein SAMN02910418_00008 [Bowdeniella nasicola]
MSRASSPRSFSSLYGRRANRRPVARRVLIALLVGGWLLARLARKYPLLRRPLAIMYAGLALGYLIWRIAYTIPTAATSNIVFGWLLLAVELIGIVQTLGFAVLFWTPAPKRLGTPLTSHPSVDVLIMTYNEPIDIHHGELARGELNNGKSALGLGGNVVDRIRLALAVDVSGGKVRDVSAEIDAHLGLRGRGGSLGRFFRACSPSRPQFPRGSYPWSRSRPGTLQES